MSGTDMRPVLIAAGGTGGHVVPALAVAEVLAARRVPVAWAGTSAGLESRLVPAAGIELHLVDVAGLRGKGLRVRLAGPLRLLRAVVQARALLRRLRPRAVLGMGGFASGPVGLAARLAGVPLVVHEQNAVAGLTNRALARLAARTFTAFPGAFPARVGAANVGNPVRADIRALAVARDGAPGAARVVPRDAGSSPDAPLRVLVIGGSRGAEALNEALPGACAALARSGVRSTVRHQAGAGRGEAARARYAAALAGVDLAPDTPDTPGTRSAPPVAVEVTDFIDDMAAAYAHADLVVCRSGAMTVTELAAAGRPAILVPYPHAVDDHQSANARWLSDAGAAVLLPQPEADAARLAAEIGRLAADRGALSLMAAAARARFVPDAAERVADALLELSGTPGPDATARPALAGGHR